MTYVWYSSMLLVDIVSMNNRNIGLITPPNDKWAYPSNANAGQSKAGIQAGYTDMHLLDPHLGPWPGFLGHTWQRPGRDPGRPQLPFLG